MLRNKVGPGPYVSTIHGAMYAPLIKDEERYAELEAELAIERNPRQIKLILREMRALASPQWVLQAEFRGRRGSYKAENFDAIIVDEASMVGEEIGSELVALAAQHKLPLIAVGDFHQLPPVAEGAYFSASNSVAAPELAEIIRQAKGSPIINLAARIRRGEGLRPERHGVELSVFPRGEVDPWAFDMILCGKNRTRHEINDDFRDEQGFYDLPPQPGEPMILLRNNYQHGICNGDIFTVVACEFEADEMWITGRFDDGRVLTFMADIEDQMDGPNMAGKAAPVGFAYAITTHKSQGSEWRDVLVVDESRVFCRDAARWLYTAATRAKERLTIVKRI